MLQKYKEALVEACRLSGFSAPLLEAVIAADFGQWLKQEKLPKPPATS